jgi:hypothetical protein
MIGWLQADGRERTATPSLKHQPAGREDKGRSSGRCRLEHASLGKTEALSKRSLEDGIGRATDEGSSHL